MEGHQRNLYLYDRFNARVAGVSRDTVETLRYWSNDLGLTFPLFSNATGHLGRQFDALPAGSPMFSRRTVIVDRWGSIRYQRNGSPDYHEILRLLKQLHAEEAGR
jgi:peroxiredoxin Q/BCP